uniref:Diacylglycerol kinase n=1 Tax=Macrostomum lignano TaxID=282301 RepID=A0A1I8IYH7_9PLAT
SEAIIGQHVWFDSGSSSELCYAGETECLKIGCKKKCAVCKIVVHSGCADAFNRLEFHCRPTFREVRDPDSAGCEQQQQQQPVTRHHWVHRRRMSGKCKCCGKQKLGNSKEVMAIECSWCKAAYHNKINCFQKRLLTESCSLGPLATLTLPPSWLVRRGGSEFSVEPPAGIASDTAGQQQQQRPLLVLTNAKSGGNLGARIGRKLLWLLNPRQVFDLAACGPEFPLRLFARVPNLRVLVCGGDGTAGWVLSAIDSLGVRPWPPVAVLPLGTGNDLARSLNWGGGFAADEPLTKMLCCVEDGWPTRLDRWSVTFKPNSLQLDETALQQQQQHEDQPEAISEQPSTDIPQAVADLRLTEQPFPDVFNNYFSLGADAAVALEFHESREANPERFNSRLRNMMFYAGEGSRSVLTRPWRELSQAIQLECDGVDYTERIKELKLTSLLFLKHHQIDGEPWRLQPSIIGILWRNQARVVMKPRRRGSSDGTKTLPCSKCTLSGSPGSSQSSSQLITESVSVLVTVTASATGADASEDHRTRDGPVQFDPLGVILIDTEATFG